MGLEGVAYSSSTGLRPGFLLYVHAAPFSFVPKNYIKNFLLFLKGEGLYFFITLYYSRRKIRKN